MFALHWGIVSDLQYFLKINVSDVFQSFDDIQYIRIVFVPIFFYPHYVKLQYLPTCVTKTHS